MLKKIFLCIICLCLCACVPVFLADTLSSQYLNIRSKLTELKSQSELVTEQLTRVSENLRISQEELKRVLVGMISILVIMITGTAVVLYLELTHKTNFL